MTPHPTYPPTHPRSFVVKKKEKKPRQPHLPQKQANSYTHGLPGFPRLLFQCHRESYTPFPPPKNLYERSLAVLTQAMTVPDLVVQTPVTCRQVKLIPP